MPVKIWLGPLFIVRCWYIQYFFISLKVILADRYDLVACIWTYQSEGLKARIHSFMSDRRPFDPFGSSWEFPKITWICCGMRVSMNESGKWGNFPNLFSTEPLPSALTRMPLMLIAMVGMTWEDPRLAVKQGFRTSCTSCAFRGFASFVISFWHQPQTRERKNHRDWKPTCTEKIANLLEHPSLTFFKRINPGVGCTYVVLWCPFLIAWVHNWCGGQSLENHFCK